MEIIRTTGQQARCRLTLIIALLALAFPAWQPFAAVGPNTQATAAALIATTLVAGCLLLFLRFPWDRHSLVGPEMRRDTRPPENRDMIGQLLDRSTLVEAVLTLPPYPPNETLVTGLAIDVFDLEAVASRHGVQALDTVRATLTRRVLKAAGDALVCRLSDSEFVCVLRHEPNAARLSLLTESLVTAITDPIDLEAAQLFLDGVIGVASMAEADFSLDPLLKKACAARGVRGAETPADNDRNMPRGAAAEDFPAVADLSTAIHGGAILPYYQPIVGLASGSVEGFECLARWVHPDLGIVMPDEFVPIAESSGEIGAMSMGLLRLACTDAAAWPSHFTLSFNISPLQLDDAWLAHRILDELDAAGVAPERLIVEITESRPLADIRLARTTLQMLTVAGVKIALDDFGTGFANLSQLRDLDVHRIKIDRRFIQALRVDRSDPVAAAIVKLAQSLGLTVTAEGIETMGSAAQLAELGCDCGQGYLFGQAIPAAEALLVANAFAVPPPGNPLENVLRMDDIRAAGTARRLLDTQADMTKSAHVH